jgi:hypothetical protein
VVGDVVRCDGALDVITAVPDDHDLDTRGTHLHLGIRVTTPQGGNSPVVWDCTVGNDAQSAAQAWVRTTAATMIELLSQSGNYATHLSADDPAGFLGWHSIHGEYAARGDSAAIDALSEWWLDNPPLPALREVLLPDLDRPELNGIKLLIGSGPRLNVAEVRVNRRVSEPASAALLSLGWPRFAQAGAYLKSFVLLVHPD